MSPFALRAIFYFSLALSAFWFAVSPAWAQFYVRSPEVEKGVAEGEEHGAVYAGPGEEERLRQSHEAEFKLGSPTGSRGLSRAFSIKRSARASRRSNSNSAANMKSFNARQTGSALPSAPFMSLHSRTIRLTRSCSARLRNT